jgi:hypothetical protein
MSFLFNASEAQTKERIINFALQKEQIIKKKLVSVISFNFATDEVSGVYVISGYLHIGEKF